MSKASNSEPPALWASHFVDYRISCNLLGQRFYIVYLMGVERRSSERLAAEGQARSSTLMLIKLLLLAVLGFSLFLTLTGLLVVTLYFLKSVMGIDMYETNSFLHGWLY